MCFNANMFQNIVLKIPESIYKASQWCAQRENDA